MDIYKARKLQKELFKHSHANPHVGIVFDPPEDGKLCYYVSHIITTDPRFMYLDDYLIKIINERSKTGVKFAIISQSHLFPSIRPKSIREGMLIIEIIEVD